MHESHHVLYDGKWKQTSTTNNDSVAAGFRPRSVIRALKEELLQELQP